MSDKKIRPADRLGNVSPSAMRELFEIAAKLRAQGKKVIDFGIGDIDIPMSKYVRDRLVEAIDEGKTRYGPNPGEFVLRKAIAKKYNTQHSLDLDEQNILVTSGAVESLLDIAFGYLNPGDEVIIQEPMFPYFGYQAILAGAKLVPVSTDLENEFKITPEALGEAITEKTKLVMINYPTNPTGGVLEHNDMKGLVEVCQDDGVILCSDEVYEKTTFDGYKAPSALDFGYENTIVINSGSKAYCMTGMRVGYAVAQSKEVIKPVAQIHQYNTAHAAVPNQLGMAAGIEHEAEIQETVLKILDERRQALVDHWSKIPGLKFDPPKATFYLYPDTTGTGMSGKEFAKFALEQGVVVVPGKTFCFSESIPGGDNCVRLSYGVGNVVDIKEAAEMLVAGLEAQH